MATTEATRMERALLYDGDPKNWMVYRRKMAAVTGRAGYGFVLKKASSSLRSGRKKLLMSAKTQVSVLSTVAASFLHSLSISIMCDCLKGWIA